MVQVLLNYGLVMVLTWLGIQPKQAEAQTSDERLQNYFQTGGASIEALREGEKALHIASGATVALSGHDTYRKHFFCDWLLGFVEVPGSHVSIRVGSAKISLAKDRMNMASILGRSPLLYGETIRESLLYKTHNVRKQDLYDLVNRLFGPSLKARVNPENPLVDVENKPVPTQILTAREHLEITQINLILQRTPLVILDLSSELMNEAILEGFRPSAELLDSGKTMLLILPPNKDQAWAESILGRKIDQMLSFA